MSPAFYSKSRDYDFLTNHAKTNFQCFQAYKVLIERDFQHIWTVSDLRLQANLLSCEIIIAKIFGPHCFHYCRHIKSHLWLRLQAYFTSINTNLAAICGLPLYRFTHVQLSTSLMLHQSHWKNLFKVRKRSSKMTAVGQELELVFVRVDGMLMPIDQSIGDHYLAVHQRRVNNITYIIYGIVKIFFSKISGSFLPKRLGFWRVKSLYR